MDCHVAVLPAMTVFARFGISEMVCPSSWSVCGSDLIRAAFYNGLCTRSIFYRVSREAGVATFFAMTRLASSPKFLTSRNARHCERSAAIQVFRLIYRMDCQVAVLLAMTVFAPAAWIATSLRSSQ